MASDLGHHWLIDMADRDVVVSLRCDIKEPTSEPGRTPQMEKQSGQDDAGHRRTTMRLTRMRLSGFHYIQCILC